jgi:hypothetical protein
VVGVPGEDGTYRDAGWVQLFPMTDLAANVGLSQDGLFPGAEEPGDRFGATLAVVAGAAERVLVVGVPDDVRNATGEVDLMPFGGTELRGRAWVPGAGGVPSGATWFGGALASSGS